MNEQTSHTFQVEPILPSEIDEAIQIIRKSLDPFEEAGSVLAATYRRLSNFSKIYNGQDAVYFVVKHLPSNTIIGGAGFGPFVGLSPQEKIGEIRELVIKKEFRGRGAGKALLQQCLGYAKENGYSRIYLETTPKMESAQNLFKRFQFQPVTQGFKSTQDKESIPCYFLLDNLPG